MLPNVKQIRRCIQRERERNKRSDLPQKSHTFFRVLSFGTMAYLLAAKSQTALTAFYYGAHCCACVILCRYPGLHVPRRTHTEIYLPAQRRAFLAGASKK